MDVDPREALREPVLNPAIIQAIKEYLRATGLDSPDAVRSINPYTWVITIGVYPGLGGSPGPLLFRGDSDEDIFDQIKRSY